MFSCVISSLCYLDLDVLRLDASASAATAVGARDAHTLLEVLVGMIDRHELVRLVALLEVALARYLVVVRVDELAQLHICSHNSNKRQKRYVVWVRVRTYLRDLVFSAAVLLELLLEEVLLEVLERT